MYQGEHYYKLLQQKAGGPRGSEEEDVVAGDEGAVGVEPLEIRGGVGGRPPHGALDAKQASSKDGEKQSSTTRCRGADGTRWRLGPDFG